MIDEFYVTGDQKFGANFAKVEPGELLKTHYQFFHSIQKKWKFSSFKTSEKVINQGMVDYRRPKNILGWLQLTPGLIKLLFK